MKIKVNFKKDLELSDVMFFVLCVTISGILLISFEQYLASFGFAGAAFFLYFIEI